jgi:hypothetical protein
VVGEWRIDPTAPLWLHHCLINLIAGSPNPLWIWLSVENYREVDWWNSQLSINLIRGTSNSSVSQSVELPISWRLISRCPSLENRLVETHIRFGQRCHNTLMLGTHYLQVMISKGVSISKYIISKKKNPEKKSRNKISRILKCRNSKISKYKM